MVAAPPSTRQTGIPYVPTDQDRKTVSAMTAFGIPQVQICAVLTITMPTLHKHFRTEIDIAAPEANARVANALFQKALAGDVACMIFWLKAKAGWRQTDKIIVQEEAPDDFDPATLTDAELATRILQFRRAAATRRNSTPEGVQDQPASVVH